MSAPAITTPASVPKGFDYAAFPAEHVEGARECAAWVRDTLGKLEAHTIETMTVVGLRLKEAKDAVGHGGFMEWVKTECGLSQKTANRAMDLAQTFDLDQIRHVTNLPQTLVYEVAASSTPETIKSEVRAKIAAGTPIERRELEVQIAKAKTDAAIFKARSRGGKPATAENIAAYQKRSEATERRNRLTYLDEQDEAARARAHMLEDSRQIVAKVIARMPASELEAIRSDLSRSPRAKVEMLAQALREELLPGEREERDATEARSAANRQLEREKMRLAK
ncbi:hypothetical protein AXW83_02750 [Bosea sp. PAMC 26642]|nr:hypothetical protein AXW83_02750 [Bosea sp. PAMC 26642]